MHLDPFEVEEFEDSDDGMVTCTNCGHGVIVNIPVWREGAGASKGGPARPCPYCCRSGTIPKRVIKIPDQYPLVLTFKKKGQASPVQQVVDNPAHEAQVKEAAEEKNMELLTREPMLT